MQWPVELLMPWHATHPSSEQPSQEDSDFTPGFCSLCSWQQDRARESILLGTGIDPAAAPGKASMWPAQATLWQPQLHPLLQPQLLDQSRGWLPGHQTQKPSKIPHAPGTQTHGPRSPSEAQPTPVLWYMPVGTAAMGLPSQQLPVRQPQHGMLHAAGSATNNAPSSLLSAAKHAYPGTARVASGIPLLPSAGHVKSQHWLGPRSDTESRHTYIPRPPHNAQQQSLVEPAAQKPAKQRPQRRMSRCFSEGVASVVADSETSLPQAGAISRAATSLHGFSTRRLSHTSRPHGNEGSAAHKKTPRGPGSSAPSTCSDSGTHKGEHS